MDRQEQIEILLDHFRNPRHRHEIEDAEVAKIVRRCHDLPGRLLFQYLDEHGTRHAVSSADVNDYLHNSMKGDFTAKDFRTWAATLHAAILLAQLPLSAVAAGVSGQQASKRNLVAVVAAVATELRNTPAVCRKSYIHPALFSAWQSGLLHRQLGRSRLVAERTGSRRKHASGLLVEGANTKAMRKRLWTIAALAGSLCVIAACGAVSPADFAGHYETGESATSTLDICESGEYQLRSITNTTSAHFRSPSETRRGASERKPADRT